MKIDKNIKFLIVGLGLIGGSYAMALKKKGFYIEAINPKQKAIDYGIEHGLINKGYTEVKKEALDKADVIIFTLYPQVFVEWIEKYGSLIKAGTLITDVTGVKSGIVEKIQDILPCGVEFIAAHPMAGREVSGVENSTDKIFKNANYIIVPTEKNSPKAISFCEQLGITLGFSKISKLSPVQHDEMIGFLSQLTHCIAISLMTCNDNVNLAKYTGDSFRDLTRIAKINENMWTELFLHNKEILVKQMDLFINEFLELRNIILSQDSEKIKEKMRLSTARRISFDK